MAFWARRPLRKALFCTTSNPALPPYPFLTISLPPPAWAQEWLRKTTAPTWMQWLGGRQKPQHPERPSRQPQLATHWQQFSNSLGKVPGGGYEPKKKDMALAMSFFCFVTAANAAN